MRALRIAFFTVLVLLALQGVKSLGDEADTAILIDGGPTLPAIAAQAIDQCGRFVNGPPLTGPDPTPLYPGAVQRAREDDA